jgi:hypothetical protein
MQTMTNVPQNTYANPTDGNTYYLASLEDGNSKVLWACPTNRDGSADFVSAIPETDFAEPLTPDDRERIVRALT